MAKIRDPKRFSDHYGVSAADLARLGVLDPTLNIDTRLFIDPLLLTESGHTEISGGARRTYERHFTRVIKFLQLTRGPSDVAWRAAQRLLSFPEIKWTCLGYGAQSVSGAGSGNEMTAQFIDTARQIVQLGVDDPDLFVAMALFEEGVGPDRISDMATNVIFGDLLRFNARVLKQLDVPVESRILRLRNGQSFDAVLPTNPFIQEGGPVLLLPTDILRDLPIATDWSDVADAASKNLGIRMRVNQQIARLWEVKSRKDKRQLRSWAMSGKDQFDTFLDMIRTVDARPYDTESDPLGELVWRRVAATLADDEPFAIEQPARLDGDSVAGIVEQIIEQFRFLIEDRRLSEELYHAGRPRPERAAQRLFFAVAHAYCKANNLDLTPEADTGNGPVDFKVSKSFRDRVLVEIKLSRNKKLVEGYTRQLEAYKTAEETLKGYYVVIDVGEMGTKDHRLTAVKNRASKDGECVSPIIFVDGTRRPSASKL